MILRLRKHLTYANVMASMAMFLVLGGGAYAAGSSILAGDAIHGCYSKQTGALRVALGRPCSRHEAPLSWNREGPAGPRGLTGAPGLNGVTGANGTNGVNGQNYTPPVAPSDIPLTVSFPGTSDPQNGGNPISFPVTGISFSSLPQTITTTSPGGGTAAPLGWSAVSFTKPRDRSSITLLHDVGTGNHFPSVTLSASAPGATKPYATWTFTQVTVGSYSLGDTADGEVDHGSFGFGSVSLSTDSSAPPAMPADPQTGQMSYIDDNGATQSVPVYVDRFGETVSLSAGSQSTGAGAGKVAFAPLSVSTALGPQTPFFLKNLAAQGSEKIKSVTITVSGAGSTPPTTYALSNAHVSGFTESSGPSVLDNLSLAYDAIMITTPLTDGQTSTTCQNVLTNTFTCPATP